eukprot:CAMPEP_0117662200 /NCGR_PEP_ID=MMETSP0804-20121206/7930_1 /TAXON_ID=1074897 /ORGANISM="Tetraselmis astigmatica, Strain CCMP880" /LENGTH=190 /DNA_ID=CAMNT_0005469091 /DNA_START=747 /DNA_END=1316 /DNA_ORIENTATION=+
MGRSLQPDSSSLPVGLKRSRRTSWSSSKKAPKSGSKKASKSSSKKEKKKKENRKTKKRKERKHESSSLSPEAAPPQEPAAVSAAQAALQRIREEEEAARVAIIRRNLEDEQAKRARAVAKGPMTAADHIREKERVREVYEPETGRVRLVKGDGEIVEQIVSRDEQQRIRNTASMTSTSAQGSTLLQKGNW